MISSEVQRTLVKSPPELWAELGDPASLARHLGELGEIRVTRIRPEEAIEWEAEDTTGTVLIKPSGWGTKVTLTVTREIATPEVPLAAPSPSQPAAELEPQATAQSLVEPGPMAQAEVEPEPMAQAEAEVEVEVEQEPEQLVDAAAAVAETSEEDAELLPRRGFFSRLFGRRQRQATADIARQPAEPYATVPNSEPQLPEAYETVWNVQPHLYEPDEPVAQAEPEPAGPTETLAHAEPEPGETVADALEQPTEAWETAAYAESQPEKPLEAAFNVEPGQTVAEQVHEPVQSADAQCSETGGELEQTEQAAAGEVTAVLIAVLDRLGAAHHRPFSRG
jgi:hypothetical protein